MLEPEPRRELAELRVVGHRHPSRSLRLAIARFDHSITISERPAVATRDHRLEELRVRGRVCRVAPAQQICGVLGGIFVARHRADSIPVERARRVLLVRRNLAIVVVAEQTRGDAVINSGAGLEQRHDCRAIAPLAQRRDLTRE